jgi:predicted metal-binding protein
LTIACSIKQYTNVYYGKRVKQIMIRVSNCGKRATNTPHNKNTHNVVAFISIYEYALMLKWRIIQDIIKEQNIQ